MSKASGILIPFGVVLALMLLATSMSQISCSTIVQQHNSSSTSKDQQQGNNLCVNPENFFTTGFHGCPGFNDPPTFSSCCDGGRCCTYEEAQREAARNAPYDLPTKIMAFFFILTIMVLVLSICHGCWVYCCLRHRLVTTGRVIATTSAVTVLPDGAQTTLYQASPSMGYYPGLQGDSLYGNINHNYGRTVYGTSSNLKS